MRRWRHEEDESIDGLMDRWIDESRSGESVGALSVDLAQPDRNGRYSGHRRTGRDVPCHDGVCADRRVVADRDSAQHRDTAPDPDFFADNDWLRGVARFSEAAFLSTLMVGVADAGVFADHAAGADRDAGHGDNMRAAGDDHTVADVYPRVFLCFKM